MFIDSIIRRIVVFLFLLFSFSVFAQNSDCIGLSQKNGTGNVRYEQQKNFQYFEKHGICLDSMNNIELYKNILPWIGTHYRYGGHTKKGIDCSGFVKAVLDSTYSLRLMGGSASISKEVQQIEKSQLKEGDLLFFYNRGKKRIGHIAMYLGNNKFVHSACGTGVIISDLNEPWYAKRFVMAGRIDHLISKPNMQGSHSEKLLLFK